MTSTIKTIVNFASLEPHAAADIAEMIRVCETEELQYLEKFARSVLSGVIGTLTERKLLAVVRRLPEGCNVLTIEQLVEKLQNEGGSIIPAHECSELEVAAACYDGRYAVSTDNFGFILRLKRLVAADQKSAEEGKVVPFFRRKAIL